MSYTIPFLQNGASRRVVAATVAPTAVQVQSTFTAVANPRTQMRVVNNGTNTAFLGAGATAAVAAANAVVVTTSGNSIPLIPGTVEILSFPADWYFTAITASGTADIYITPGEGL